MNQSDNKSVPKLTNTTLRPRGNGWGGVAAMIFAFAIVLLWLGTTTGKLGYAIGAICLLAIAVVLLAAPRTREVSQRPVETPPKRDA